MLDFGRFIIGVIISGSYLFPCTQPCLPPGLKIDFNAHVIRYIGMIFRSLGALILFLGHLRVIYMVNLSAFLFFQWFIPFSL